MIPASSKHVYAAQRDRGLSSVAKRFAFKTRMTQPENKHCLMWPLQCILLCFSLVFIFFPLSSPLLKMPSPDSLQHGRYHSSFSSLLFKSCTIHFKHCNVKWEKYALQINNPGKKSFISLSSFRRGLCISKRSSFPCFIIENGKLYRYSWGCYCQGPVVLSGCVLGSVCVSHFIFCNSLAS